MTITVQVRLFSRFRTIVPAEAQGRTSVQLPAGASVSQLLDALDLGSGEHGRVRLVSVNDQPQPDPDYVLRDGDRVRIFPFVVGG